jgi:hypothetical protein
VKHGPKPKRQRLAANPKLRMLDEQLRLLAQRVDQPVRRVESIGGNVDPNLI